MSPGLLDSVLSRLPKQDDPNVVVGFDTADDAGVYRLPEGIAPDVALVQTVDFFTPIVDDPYTFGEIAAANSLSDVYAMGGRPITALAIAGFPNSGKAGGILEDILRGGLSKMQEASCTVIGGHTIGDEEIKFGYAVTGLINLQRVLTNSRARPGDRLVLTKRLGTGIIGTAIKQGQASKAATEGAIGSMRALNRLASEVALKHGVRAATDITGFGLLGHAREMAAGSKVSMVIDSSSIEFLPEAQEYARLGMLPGGLKRNIEFVSGCVEWADTVAEAVRSLLYDPQTSGGLFLAVGPAAALDLLTELQGLGIPSREVGQVIDPSKPLIMVR